MTIDERLWKTFNKALGQYQLIDEDDHILVGLSGGKDSLLLLEFLARRAKIHVPHFTVEALHVRMDFSKQHKNQSFVDTHYETNTSYLQHFCDQLGVPLHIVTTSFDRNPKPHTKQKPPCFLCSWERRKQLFNVAQELHCTKIALGHHQDDIIHTALMNLTFQGHFLYSKEHHYEKQLKLCPYEHETNRTTARELFTRMEQLNPEARYCIWRALESDNKLIEY